MARNLVGGVLDVDRLVTVIEDFNTMFIRLASVQKLNFSALSVFHGLSRGGPMRLTDRLDDHEQAVLADAQEVLSRMVAIARDAPAEPSSGSRVRPHARRMT